MIENFNQYWVTQDRLKEFRQSVEILSADTPENRAIDQDLRKLQIDAMNSQIVMFETEIAAYRTKHGASNG